MPELCNLSMTLGEVKPDSQERFAAFLSTGKMRWDALRWFVAAHMEEICAMCKLDTSKVWTWKSLKLADVHIWWGKRFAGKDVSYVARA